MERQQIVSEVDLRMFGTSLYLFIALTDFLLDIFIMAYAVGMSRHTVIGQAE